MMPYTTNNNNNNNYSCHNGFVEVGREKNGSLDFHMREFLSVHSRLFLFLLIGPATVTPFCFTTSEKRDGTAAKCVGGDDNDDKLRWVCNCVRKLW